MQILENNFTRQKGKDITCPCCGSRLRFTKDDLRHASANVRSYVVCPCCTSRICIDDNGETLFEESYKELPDADHYTFPDDFSRYFKDAGPTPVSDEETQKMIEEGIRRIRESENPDGMSYWGSESGDTVVMIHRLEDDEEYYVVVSKNSYEAELPFTQKDYCSE